LFANRDFMKGLCSNTNVHNG